MKPKNFPAKKLRRKLIADGEDLESPQSIQALSEARGIRTKKDGSRRGRVTR